jgi:DNA-binding response OmpR family regulator
MVIMNCYRSRERGRVMSRTSMRKTILIVDDDTDLLDMLKCSFAQAGFSTVTATDGKDGLSKARTLAPDLIVLDLVLPELDGFTVCETLRRDRATAGIPIIMLTGLTSQLNRFAGLGCGAVDYVTKPITADQLLARVEGLLGNAPEYLHADKRADSSIPARLGHPA